LFNFLFLPTNTNTNTNTQALFIKENHTKQKNDKKAKCTVVGMAMRGFRGPGGAFPFPIGGLT
jgi:hypothetical protein